jgi:hypothetical protein
MGDRVLPSIGDYLIVSVGEKPKKYCAKVLETKDSIRCRIEASKIEGKRTSLEIDVESIVVNLGKNPPFGTVYGVSVEPLKKATDLENWGEIHFYRKLKKIERKALNQALKKVWNKIVVPNKLQECAPLTFEVRHHHGRWDGYYKSSPKQEQHSITLKPKGFLLDDTLALITHELGHAVDHTLVPDRVRARWVKLYTDYRTLSTVKTSTLRAILSELEEAGSTRAAKKSLANLSDSTKGGVSSENLLKECLKYIHHSWGLSTSDLNLLLSQGESLEEYWPKNSLDIADDSKGKATMTEYGMTSPTEFFSEAFRLYFEGKSGRRITKLMKKTLRSLQKQNRDGDPDSDD